MQIERAREIIKYLADGVDPTTGELLPPESVYNKPDVIRALFTIWQETADPVRNAGKPWNDIEDSKLVDEFASKISVNEMAAEHGRSHDTIQYNKLVRDRIPEIIEASGKACSTEILSDAEYLRMLDAKLDEELAEYHQDQNIEELADLLEVIYAAAQARGYTREELEQCRAGKAEERGSFEKHILLKEVFDSTSPESLIGRICAFNGTLLEKVSDSMLARYCWLQDNLFSCNVAEDAVYRKTFAGYYRMRFVSQQYKDAFFELFERIKNQPDIPFEMVAYELYTVDGRHEFSFISKMLHTINPSRPIYDSQVDKALSIHRTYQSDFKQRIKKDAAILDRIAIFYQNLASSTEIKGILNKLNARSPAAISPEKGIDFILWALGDL